MIEVFADGHINMKNQALKTNTCSKNVYVKIPISDSKGIFRGKIKELNNLNVNISAVYSTKQTKKI